MSLYTDASRYNETARRIAPKSVWCSCSHAESLFLASVLCGFGVAMLIVFNWRNPLYWVIAPLCAATIIVPLTRRHRRLSAIHIVESAVHALEWLEKVVGSEMVAYAVANHRPDRTRNVFNAICGWEALNNYFTESELGEYLTKALKENTFNKVLTRPQFEEYLRTEKHYPRNYQSSWRRGVDASTSW
jgi:hypothetical protein